MIQKISQAASLNSNNSACARCQSTFFCAAKRSHERCWCLSKPKILVNKDYNSCLCEQCFNEEYSRGHKASTYRIILAYHGGKYSGYQMQENARTVEAELKKAFGAILQISPDIVVAGRTDAGVHADGQVISLSFSTRMSLSKLTLALASKLPYDISIRRIDKMPFDFNARKQSIGKQYIYSILNSLGRDPFLHGTVWHIRPELDLKLMQKAAECFVGEHDFESFRSSHCVAAHARRYIWHVAVEKKGHIIEIDIRGNAFCHNMVRIIVGCLVDAGLKKISADDIKAIFLARDRKKAAMTAPALGLSLKRVYYPDDLSGALIPEEARFPRFPVSSESWPFLAEDLEIGPR
jgi:tRNA pseudouridine38-40 synthase